MSKSNGNGHGFFGRSNRNGAVTVIETPVSRSYRRKAKVAFWVTSGVVGLLAATVASHYTHPIVGLILGALLGATVGFTVGALVTMWPVLRVFWHWLPELVLTTGVIVGWTQLMRTANVYLSLAIVAVVVGVPAVIGRVRRRLVAWAWCLIVRHRLRLCFAAFIATNRHGSLPLILLARPTPAGERVWLWLRPGLSLHDLEGDGQVQKLAVACWANQVRVARDSSRYAALVRVDITRRDPLTHTIVSPLPALVPDDTPHNAPVSPAVAPSGLDLPDVPEEPVTASATDITSRRKPRTTSTAPVERTDAFDPNYDYA